MALGRSRLAQCSVPIVVHQPQLPSKYLDTILLARIQKLHGISWHHAELSILSMKGTRTDELW